jgi:hypothetical protein
MNTAASIAPTPEARPRRRWYRRLWTPVAISFLLAPVFGELLSSSQPMPIFLISWLPLATLYGCGALLVREAGVRWGTGWLAIILLGLAYGIYEEGLVVRSFFDPEWQDLDALAVYGRAGGVNWLWAELLTFFHAAVSIAATLVVVEVLFPESRRRPILRRRGLIWCTVGMVFWLAFGPLEGMDATAVHLLGSAAVIGALAAAARWLPSPLLVPRPDAVVPRPRRFFLVGLVATAVTFLWIFIAAEELAPAAWVTGVGVAAVNLLAVWWVARASGNAAAWNDRHRVALVWGILSFMAFLATFVGGPLGPVVAVGTMYGMWRLHRLTERRTESTMEAEVAA